MTSPFDYDADCSPPYEFIRVKRPRNTRPALARSIRRRILVHTVHDGAAIPRKFRYRSDGSPRVDLEQLDRMFVTLRDWGADFVASELSRALGVDYFGRVRVARALIDFNRFPGSTPPGIMDPAELLAISTPFSEALNHDQKASLLEDYYDSVSDILEDQALPHKILTIAVHTYDERNPSLTQRPDVSIITRPIAYQRESRMPYGLFDPLYPDRLAESTCSRILRDRISLNLERAGFRVSHNHPYALPNGSLEVRAQVWYFFNYLRERFERAVPESKEDPSYLLVWAMLQNTNLRMAEGEALRGYLHRFRKVSRSQRSRFQKAQHAYDRVSEFMHESRVLTNYRRSQNRPSSLGIEVRKDLVRHIDPDTGYPIARTKVHDEMGRRIAQLIAESIGIYFEHDRAIETQRPKDPPPAPPGTVLDPITAALPAPPASESEIPPPSKKAPPSVR